MSLQDGSTCYFWMDLWDGQVHSQSYSELFSFAKNKRVTFNKEFHTEPLHLLFHLPLSVETYNQFLLLENKVDNFQLTADKDWWTYIWGTSQFSSQKAYRHLLGHADTHPVFRWLWKSCCQNKHKVFFFFREYAGELRIIALRRKRLLKAYNAGQKGRTHTSTELTIRP